MRLTLEIVYPQDLGIGRFFGHRKALREGLGRDNRCGSQYKADSTLEPGGCQTLATQPPRRLGSALRLCHRLRGSKHRASIARYAKGGYGFYSDSHKLPELPALRKDDQEICVELSLSDIRKTSDPGARTLVLAVARNITKRKRGEEALKESKECFWITFEQVATRVARVGTHGSWLQVEEKPCDVVGYTPEDLLGLTLQAVTHSDELEVEPEQAPRLLDGELETHLIEERREEYLRLARILPNEHVANISRLLNEVVTQSRESSSRLPGQENCSQVKPAEAR